MLFLDCRNVFASDTREKSRFKIKHTEPSTNVEGTTNSGDNSQDGSNSHNNYNQTLFTAAAQKKKQTITKREKTKGKQKHHQNLSDDSVEEGNSTKSHRFQIISKFECQKWELPVEVADYVNHKF